MRIKRMLFPVKVLGPGDRVGIWMTGCPFKCEGCIAPELRDFNSGRDIPVEKIIEVIEKIPSEVSGVTVSGGEPFEQSEELSLLVTALNEKGIDDIIVYSGYTLSELREKNSDAVNNVLSRIAVLVDGRYVDELNDSVGLRGSSNQVFHIFRNKELYEYMKTAPRELQHFDYLNDSSIVIGIL